MRSIRHSRRARALGALAGAAAFAAFAACSGGGTSGNASPALPQSEAASPAATVSPSSGNLQSTIAGTVVDLPYDGTSANPGYSVVPPNGTAPRAGSPIAGARVYVGLQIVAGSTPPPAVPAGFVSAVTDANGAFRITNGPTGAVAISIFAGAPHTAALHADLTLAGGTNAVGPYYLSVPSAAETAWLAQTNVDRAAYGAPPLGLDEAALEAARYWAAFMQRNGYFAHCIPASACEAGDTTAPPASYGPQDVDPDHRFWYEHGFSGAQEGENIAAGFPNWESVDAAFMAERSACPNGQAVNCPFTEATGHFLNIIDASYSWAGFGIAAPAGSRAYYDEEFTLVASTSPTVAARSRRPLARGLAR